MGLAVDLRPLTRTSRSRVDEKKACCGVCSKIEREGLLIWKKIKAIRSAEEKLLK